MRIEIKRESQCYIPYVFYSFGGKDGFGYDYKYYNVQFEMLEKE